MEHAQKITPEIKSGGRPKSANEEVRLYSGTCTAMRHMGLCSISKHTLDALPVRAGLIQVFSLFWIFTGHAANGV